MPQPDPLHLRGTRMTDRSDAVLEDAAAADAGLDALDTPSSPAPALVRRIAGDRCCRRSSRSRCSCWCGRSLWAAAFWPEFKLPAPADVWDADLEHW